MGSGHISPFVAKIVFDENLTAPTLSGPPPVNPTTSGVVFLSSFSTANSMGYCPWGVYVFLDYHKMDGPIPNISLVSLEEKTCINRLGPRTNTSEDHNCIVLKPWQTVNWGLRIPSIDDIDRCSSSLGLMYWPDNTACPSSVCTSTIRRLIIAYIGVESYIIILYCTCLLWRRWAQAECWKDARGFSMSDTWCGDHKILMLYSYLRKDEITLWAFIFKFKF